MSTPFQENDLILFTGDSTTDCGRNRNDPKSLGDGYVNMIAGRLGLDYPELNLHFRNTGIGGDVVRELLGRWDRDCIALHRSKQLLAALQVRRADSRYRFRVRLPRTAAAREGRDVGPAGGLFPVRASRKGKGGECAGRP